ncbi:HK97-gp10 family putative phage morphogenesis protein [Limosilactobacillus fermentum]|uniref:HK97-gp10 family putative phage morphogenesis protein n=1 Tax=Limosilactobacillus fermentum TaxID=1613 RepID=UPI002AC9187E|nr:HK97-gp10 family putative phage morphogenesis protein [Limosilactobacillus fermentum]
MDNLDSQIEAFVNKAEKALVPDHDTQKAMTSAGAKVLAEKLREATPRTNHKDVKYGHLQDNVMSQDTDINGEDNGNSTVGFGKKAYIARFLNDGTIKMGATHFVDNARRNATDEVFVAQQKVYEERLGDDS